GISVEMLRRGKLLSNVCASSATVADAASNFSNLISLEVPEARTVFLKPSTSPRRKPSVYIPHNIDSIPADVVAVNPADLGGAIPTFRIASPTCDYYALRIPLLKAGFRRVPDDAVVFSSNIVWGKSAPVAVSSPRWEHYVPRNAYQKFNHFPRSHKHLGDKRGMAQSLRQWDESVANTFTPQTLFYPAEKEAIEKLMTNGAPGKRYIWKPSRGSCGRGIMISRSGAEDNSWRLIMKEIDYKASDTTAPDMARIPYMSYVVQEYIENPLIVDGRKLDLRLYVGVTSFDPLTVYLHNEGLVRFAAEAYANNSPPSSLAAAPGSNSDMRFKHLTNYSLGRKLEADQHGSLDLKWPLNKFRTRLDEIYGADHASLSYTALMAKAKRVIVETLLAAKSNISAATKRQNVGNGGDNYVELFGFDIMFDDSGNAWLIEVNTLPSLESSSTMDYHVKSAVTTDLLNMGQLELFRRPASAFETCGVIPPMETADPNVLRRLGDLLHSESGLCHEGASSDMTIPSSSNSLFELQMKLYDEHRYRGGFERIFPSSKHPLVPHHMQTLSPLDLAAAQFTL
ncbi:tubulin-tyrosine ligase, putative, partial [Bodo saltans]